MDGPTLMGQAADFRPSWGFHPFVLCDNLQMKRCSFNFIRFTLNHRRSLRRAKRPDGPPGLPAYLETCHFERDPRFNATRA